MKILIVEDERELAMSIQHYVQDEGCLVEIASAYKEAIDKMWGYHYDCILIDITLPDGNGFNLIKEFKKMDNNSGIIVISARDGIDDKIKGLDLGADDYLAKPFHLSELNARIKSVIRRRSFDGNNELKCNEITLNTDNHNVYVSGEALALTPKEYELLLYLLVNKDRVLSKEAIVEHLWGDYISCTSDSFDFLYTHMRNLRKKLAIAKAGDYIKSVYSVGYKFTTEPKK